MKRNILWLGILAIALVFGMTVVGCDDGSTGNDGNGNDNKPAHTVNSIAELEAYLAAQPANTAATPYNVGLKVSDLTGIKDAFLNNPDKYVSLDLTGSTITTVPDNAFFPRTSGDGEEFVSIPVTNLIGIILPNTVTSIGDGAFFDCSRLASVTIPNSVLSIGEAAFSGCTKLAGVTLPNRVTSIGIMAFGSCNSITSITIPTSLSRIENWVFSNTSITSVTIPNNITSIGIAAFLGCSKLASVTFQGTISSSDFADHDLSTFDGDLRAKYLAGGIGTYTTTTPVNNNSVWTKQGNGGGGPINPGTGGTFTVTGIPSQYNGKYAFFEGMRDNPELYVFGCQSINFATETVAFTQISNGSVSLPMWTSSDGVSAVRYSGNSTVYGFIGISSSATATGDIDANAIGSRGWRSITFSNGSATKSWNDGEDL